MTTREVSFLDEVRQELSTDMAELTEHRDRGRVNVAPFPKIRWRNEGRGLGAPRLPVTGHLNRP